MKQITKLFTLATVMIAFSVATFAQSATGLALATVVTPLSITAGASLNFGSIVGTAVGGNVIVDLTNTRSGPAALITMALPAPTSATFSVSGQPNATYSIALPAGSVTIGTGVAGQTMSVGSFTSNPVAGVGSGLLSGTGAQTIIVGGTLAVGAGQAPGTYRSDASNGSNDFTVTVNYN
jgi:hypothetical protein